MISKTISGLLATALALAFFAVPIIKLKETALIVVILIGVALMFVDLFEKLRSKED